MTDNFLAKSNAVKNAVKRDTVAVRILIADDHDVVREGVRAILKKRSDWVICGEAANGQEAMAQIESLQPDVVILDITMPKMSGLEVAKKVSLGVPRSRVVMFTMHDSGTVEQAVRGSGAHGLVLKVHAARDLVKAVNAVAEGGTFFASEL